MIGFARMCFCACWRTISSGICVSVCVRCCSTTVIARPGARRCVVAPSVRSEAAKRKDATRRTNSGHPVKSFQDLLGDLATLTRNRIRIVDYDVTYEKLATPTVYQQHVLDLLGVTL